jgi:hypothetical protein
VNEPALYEATWWIDADVAPISPCKASDIYRAEPRPERRSSAGIGPCSHGIKDRLPSPYEGMKGYSIRFLTGSDGITTI